MNHLIGELLGRLWTLLSATCYSNRSVFPIPRLYLADTIVAPARTALWSKLKAARNRFKLILAYSDNTEISFPCLHYGTPFLICTGNNPHVGCRPGCRRRPGLHPTPKPSRTAEGGEG